jgi:hypothetical protein
MGKALAVLFGGWVFVLSGFNPVVAAIAAGVGAAVPEKRKKHSSPEAQEYRYNREIKLTHYPDGTVKREESEY